MAECPANQRILDRVTRGKGGNERADSCCRVVDKQQRAAKYPFLQSARIAVAGQSCGGLEAYAVVNDTRIGALGVFNSGFLTEAEAKTVVPTIKGKPVFYFLGGSTDIAYANVSEATLNGVLVLRCG